MNVGKSVIMVFNKQVGEAATSIRYKSLQLEEKSEFKFLGVVFGRKGMRSCANSMTKSLMGALQRVRVTATKYGVEKRPHVLLWLYQAFAMGTGMYGCQVWSSLYLRERDMLSSPLEHLHLGFSKACIGGEKDHRELVCIVGVWSKAFSILLVQSCYEVLERLSLQRQQSTSNYCKVRH